MAFSLGVTLRFHLVLHCVNRHSAAPLNSHKLWLHRHTDKHQAHTPFEQCKLCSKTDSVLTWAVSRIPSHSNFISQEMLHLKGWGIASHNSLCTPETRFRPTVDCIIKSPTHCLWASACSNTLHSLGLLANVGHQCHMQDGLDYDNRATDSEKIIHNEHIFHNSSLCLVTFLHAFNDLRFYYYLVLSGPQVLPNQRK